MSEEAISVIAQLQGQMIAHHHIMRELVIQLAKSQREPKQYLSTLYDRVSGTLAQGDTDDKFGHPVNAEIRWVVDSFFTHASIPFSKKGG